jgi:hypothetical protein
MEVISMAMMWGIREGMTVRPFGAESATAFGKIPFNKPFQVEIKQPRNSKHHRLFFALCARIGDAVGCEHEDIVFLLKLRTGHVRRIHTKKGVIEAPLSISFAQMDQTMFREFFDKCVHVIYTEFGIAVPDVLEAVKDLLEEKAA